MKLKNKICEQTNSDYTKPDPEYNDSNEWTPIVIEYFDLDTVPLDEILWDDAVMPWMTDDNDDNVTGVNDTDNTIKKSRYDNFPNCDGFNNIPEQLRNHETHYSKNASKVKEMLTEEGVRNKWEYDDEYFYKDYGEICSNHRRNISRDRFRQKYESLYAAKRNDDYEPWNISDGALIFIRYFDPVDLLEIYDYVKNDDGMYIPTLKCSESERKEFLKTVPFFTSCIDFRGLYNFMKSHLIRTDYMVEPKSDYNSEFDALIA